MLKSLAVAAAAAAAFILGVAILSSLDTADVVFGIIFGVCIGAADLVRRRRRTTVAG